MVCELLSEMLKTSAVGSLKTILASGLFSAVLCLAVSGAYADGDVEKDISAPSNKVQPASKSDDKNGVDASAENKQSKYKDLLNRAGKMLFNTGGDKLSPETATLLESITADSLPRLSRPLVVRESVKIEKFTATNPFQETDNQAPVDKIIGHDNSLIISVRKPDNTRLRDLQTAYDAFQSGQYESAIFFYKKVLAEDEKNKDALFGLAATYQRSGQLEQARDYYVKLINLDQNNWSALNNFLVLASDEAPNDALRQLKDLESSNPQFAPIPAQIGMIYIQQNNMQEAARSLSKAVSIDPSNISYRYVLAVVMDRLGKNDVAVKLYNQVLEAGRKGSALPESVDKIQDRIMALSAISRR